MNILRPVSISEANLISSDVPEDDYAEYLPSTTYSEGGRVLILTTHKIYESLQDGNTGNDPTTDDGTWWLDCGYDNRWKMFDNIVSTTTVKQGSMEINLQIPAFADSIALLNVDAETITVQTAVVSNTEAFFTFDEGVFKTADDEEFHVKTEPIYFRSISVDSVQSVNSVESTSQKNDIVLTGITENYDPATTDLALLITLKTSVPNANVSCGMCVLGVIENLGVLEWAPTVGIIDYSQKTTDTFGNPTILERQYAKRLSAQLWIENNAVDDVVRRLAQYRATPVVWFGSADFDSTIVYGWYRSFDVVIESPAGSRCSLEIEGLI